MSCRLGEVTLRDFKTAIDREGNHRYHFKALDPEFGTVKEEVSKIVLDHRSPSSQTHTDYLQVVPPRDIHTSIWVLTVALYASDVI